MTIKGTQQLHRFRTISQTNMEVYEVSTGAPIGIVQTVKHATEQVRETDKHDRIGTFVLCRAEDTYWLGAIRNFSEEFGDCHVNMLHPKAPAETYHWPSQEDMCWVPAEDIVWSCECPSVIPAAGYYKFQLPDSRKINILVCHQH